MYHFFHSNLKNIKIMIDIFIICQTKGAGKICLGMWSFLYFGKDNENHVFNCHFLWKTKEISYRSQSSDHIWYFFSINFYCCFQTNLHEIYCGFINTQGYQFSWIHWKSHFQGYVDSWPMILLILNVSWDCTSINIKFHGPA